ncbi:hypothetical protein RJ639_003983 [Escallonia herrerae]|uniref:J domain-containing protein n=1 Tax=Escallonia herrerae TaxID=1293975 RepID=A0AA88VYA6_9ASTE|nr:hypothetical protein RJ639_003983 [Escallonia herrerae]
MAADHPAEPPEKEALRLKTLAEQKYTATSNLKSALKYANKAHRLSPHLDGLPELLTALQILHTATTSTTATATTPLYYQILQIEPFSHINAIKKQYKKLALTLHPDKNPFIASEEAFKLVGEAFRVLSDKIRRKEYDMQLRIALQEAATEGNGEVKEVETFWTACSTCRLLHQFERRYLGHNLVCPSCKKSFKAVEVSTDVHDGASNREKDGEEGEGVGIRSSARIRARSGGDTLSGLKVKQKMSSVGEVLERSRRVNADRDLSNVVRVGNGIRPNRVEKSDGGVDNGIKLKRVGKSLNVGGEDNGSKSNRVERSSNVDKKDETNGGIKVLRRLSAKRVRRGESGEEEMLTLAEMQVLAKRKVQEEKEKLNSKENEKGGEKENGDAREKRDNEGASKKNGNVSINGDMEMMSVEDSDFHDFDKDRGERNFRKGQVWAIYDDDDGMPRHYSLIEEVVSVHPFEVKISWLDLQRNRDDKVMIGEKNGIHVSCGKFKVAGKTTVHSVNVFSHLADCERVARDMYMVYPKKGSVWALYKENSMDGEGRDVLVKDKRCYDIVIFLTSYSDIYGLSMAYLEKVDGFKTVFKRREIGCHAIRFLEKDDVWLLSHQIPAKKLSGKETSDLSKDCWELDPASLPPELLTNCRGR